MPDHTPTHLVVDTSAILADPWFQDANSQITLENIEAIGVELIVPQVVVEELVSKVRQQAEEAQQQLIRSARKIDRLIGPELEFSTDTADLDSLEVTLRQRIETITRETNGRIAKLPQVSHAHLVKKILSGSLPFTKGEKGYRDALLWASVLEICREAPQCSVVLLTANTNDFCQVDEDLHSDLKAEVAEASTAARVTVITTLRGFVQESIAPYLEKRATEVPERKELESPSSDWSERIRTGAETELQKIIGTDEHLYESDLSFGAEGYATSIALDLIDLTGFNTNSVSTLNRHRHVVQITAETTVEMWAEFFSEDLAEAERYFSSELITQRPGSSTFSVSFGRAMTFDLELIVRIEDDRPLVEAISVLDADLA